MKAEIESLEVVVLALEKLESNVALNVLMAAAILLDINVTMTHTIDRPRPGGEDGNE